MCGIAGYFNFQHAAEENIRLLERMIFPLAHRGPDGYGFFQDGRAGLAHARLSIIDLEGGWQPIPNEDRSLWVIFNGEIFNYPELREQLIARGHQFATNSDTEVIIHLYEDFGAQCLKYLNGQFAIAIYDVKKQELFLARDRMGIRPLFYLNQKGRVYFASEIKALFNADPAIERSLHTDVLGEIFTFWSAGGGNTVFRGVQQLEPGHWLRLDSQGQITEKQYWDIPLAETGFSSRSEDELAGELRDLLIDAVRLRLRADVPVGAYLSGGLDSSSVASLVRNYTGNSLKTFSVTFSDAVYDESAEQDTMVRHLGTDHHQISCDYDTIARQFPDVIWHTETPILRTAPTPLFLLSSLVRSNGYKVVLTGEGADEVLGGYDLFKEAKVRAFIGRQPDSACRPLLLKRLYPYLALSPTRSAAFAREFFDTDQSPADDLFFGHGPRWKTGSFLFKFFHDDLRCNRADPVRKLSARYGSVLAGMDYFSRAQYIECKLLLANYLLNSQGDRMAMAHSVEGRFPFLDYRVVEFAASLPLRLRMKGLREKYLLKRAMRDLLPPAVTRRSKQPYMAPDILSFFGGEQESPCIEEFLSEAALCESGLFSPGAVNALLKKCRKKIRQGFRENMALVGILSTQIIHARYIKSFSIPMPDRLPNTRIRVI